MAAVAEVVERELAGHTVVWDYRARALLIDGAELKVSRLVRDLVVLMLDDPLRFFTRQELGELVWGHGVAGGRQSRTLDTHISRARRILADAGIPGAFVNVWGEGYRLMPLERSNRT